MNLAYVVKRKSGSKESDEIANEMSTFLKQINKKLSLMGLTLEDFKKDGAYDFGEATADKLIELYDFSLGHNVSRFEKNKIELVDRNMLVKYLTLVEELCSTHFSYDDMQKIDRKLSAIQTELNLYEKISLKKVAVGLFNEGSKLVNVAALHEIEKLFVDIYSTNKYPYLNEMDRVSLFTELESKLAFVIEEHQASIKKVNIYRSQDEIQDENINCLLDL